MLRKIMIAMMGHVDHGKTSLLDRIRRTSITEREAGLITQSIGASIIPIETIQRVCGDLLKQIKMEITIPGILAIDTPGHAAFSSLRKRGGSLADIAIIVVDINEGFKPQTIEAIEVAKAAKTPFIIAANKVDLLPGWKKHDTNMIASIGQQDPSTQQLIETRLYEIVGQLHEHAGLNGERFDRVEDYTQQVAIVPCSAHTSEGIPELLMVLTGLSQRYLEKNLKINVEGPAKGTVLEVKEEKGLGKTLDVIIYDGTLDVNDTIVVGGIDGPIVTKVKALFEPNPHAQIGDKRTKFQSMKHISAATGVKISAKDIENATAGMPLIEVGPDQTVEEVKELLQKEINMSRIETDPDGIIIKANAVGSLEAMAVLLKEKGFKIRKGSIGDISKKDLIDAESAYEKNPLNSVILGFNIKCPEGIRSDKVKVITSDIIYTLMDEYEKWKLEMEKAKEKEQLTGVKRPFKFKILDGYVFRQNNPAVVGVDILEGTVRTNIEVMKDDGKPLTVVKSLQHEKKTVDHAERGKQVAVSLPHVTVGRQIEEGDTLYSFIPEEDFRKLKKLKDLLDPDEKACLKAIAQIMRNHHPMWGV